MSNITQITASAGSDLMVIAAQQYGDPMLWTAIAAQNGLADPVLTGTMVLALPPAPVSSDGILYR